MDWGLILPFIAAALWGLVYVMWEKVLGTVGVPTMFAVGSIIGLGIALLMATITKEPIDFKVITQNKMWLMVLVALVLGQVASYITTYATRSDGALYAAMGEISYPLFIPIFALLILGTSQLSWGMVIGGGLITVGAFVMVWDKL